MTTISTAGSADQSINPKDEVKVSSVAVAVDDKPKARDRLVIGETLDKGQSLVSANGKFQLVNQDDGNIVLGESGRPIWATGTGDWTNPTYSMMLQENGDVVVKRMNSSYNEWSIRDGSWFNRVDPAKLALILQDDANLVLSANGKIVWGTNTAQRTDEKQPGNGNRSWIYTSETLKGGDVLLSQNGKFECGMHDGALVVRWKEYGSEVWSAGRGAGNSAESATLSPDGELKVVTWSGYDKWTSGTAGKGEPNSFLRIEDNGNLTITSRGQQIWATNTVMIKDGPKPTPRKGPSSPDRLKVGEALSLTQSLVSPNGQYRLTYREDGNLVLYDAAKKSLWESGTASGNIAQDVFMQGDDNLVIQPAGQGPRWASNTPRNNGGGTAELIVEDRGIAVIKSNNVIRWCTNGDFVQKDFSSFSAVPAGSDRVRPNQYLPEGQALVSGNKQFSAMIQSDGIMVIQYNPLNLVVWSMASPAGRKAAKVVVDGGSRLWTYAADDTLVWKCDRDDYRHSDNGDFVMRDDGVLSFWGDDPWGGKIRVWNSDVSFPACGGSTNSLTTGQYLVRGQSLIADSARLTIESNGMLTLSTDGGSTKKYLYLTDDSGKYITDCNLASLSGDGCLELLDIKFQSLWKNPKQEVEDYSRYDYRSRPERVDPAFRLYDNGVFECNDEYKQVNWQSKFVLKGDSTSPPANVNKLLPGGIMSSGATLTSFNGFYTLAYQGDGNLVLTGNYSNRDRERSKVLWASNTTNYQVGKVTMFAHGNMVISDAADDLQWNTATPNRGTGATLTLQNDGNLVIYIDGGKSVWATNTGTGSRRRW